MVLFHPIKKSSREKNLMKKNPKFWTLLKRPKMAFLGEQNFTIKKTPPLYSPRSEYRGGFLIAKILLPQKCYFWTFQKTTTFLDFFHQIFFSHDDFFIRMKQYYVYFSFGVSILVDFFVFALSFESKN